MSTVGEVTRRVTKGTTPTTLGGRFEESGINFIKVESINDSGALNQSKLAFISEETHRQLVRSVIDTDDILFSIAGTIGRVARVQPSDLPANTNQAVAIIRPDIHKIDRGFLYYCLRDTDRIARARTRVVQSVQQNLSLTEVSNIELPIPPLPEQRAIAATLGAIDDKIESNRRATTYISSLIDAQSAQIGMDLPAVPLGHVVASVKASVNPVSLGESLVDHFSLPAFDAGARPERVVASSIKSNKLRLPGRAILLSRLNPRFNRTWWASSSDVPALASTEFLVLTAPEENLLAAAWLAVRAPFFQEELPRRVTGTSGSHQRVRPDDVLTIKVPDFTKAPSALKFAVLTMLQRAESLRTESDRLVALRDSLLPQLLSGRIRVPPEEGTL
ncbi:type I restriction enzyme, S subunit [Brevibacterium aurantiacum]|uniref:Type I restriction enzyme, S subunit n=2 Tax=Brevibacterium aurantiacum TaxID=273384 RepID=A0A2H1K008_BREAU|nr:type I restriction enzyme, S subunit [Brevibacterium aurantiacum]